MTMRSVLLRCLIVLLALTFVGGSTVNAPTHSMRSGAEDTVEAEAIISMGRQHRNTHACLCCCLGCASFANRAPDCTSGVVPVFAIVSYGERINALAGRTLHPEPYPPRPMKSS